MSAAACKAAICNSNASATADETTRLIRRGEFTDDQLEELTNCADKFIKDTLRIISDD